MHKHCAVEGMARKLITRLGIRPEFLLGFGDTAPGVQSLGLYWADDIARELATYQRSDLIGMLASVVDGVSGLSEHALRLIASGLILEKMTELLCLIDEARGGSIAHEGRLLMTRVKVVYNPAAPSGVEVRTSVIAEGNGRKVVRDYMVGDEEDVLEDIDPDDYSDLPSDAEINELANDIDLDIDDEEFDRIIDRYREGVGV